MRTGIFIHGRKFYSGWRERAVGRRIRFAALADWLLSASGGTQLEGSYYFTGVDTSAGDTSESARRLSQFLHMLDQEPGFFVRRFPRAVRPMSCAKCAARNRRMDDRALEIALTTEVLSGVARGAFEQVILVSPVREHAVIADTVRQMGCRTYVASWGPLDVPSFVQKSFARLDLVRGLSHFEDSAGAHPAIAMSTGVSGTPAPADPSTPHHTPIQPIPAVRSPIVERTVPQLQRKDPLDECLAEIQRAEIKFTGGYLGLSYFVTRWRAMGLDSDPDVRRRLIDQLVMNGKAEIYVTPDGTKGLRAKK